MEVILHSNSLNMGFKKDKPGFTQLKLSFFSKFICKIKQLNKKFVQRIFNVCEIY